MKVQFAWLLAMVMAGSASLAADSPEIPDAAALMRSVVAQLPPQPLALHGEFVVRRRRGVTLAKYPFAAELHWGAQPPVARYYIRRPDGTPLEALQLTRDADGPELLYTRGAALEKAPAPRLGDRIQESDISWLDLTLDFLWWHHPSITGEETVKNRECYVVTIPRPDGVSTEYDGVRLWIEKQHHMMLQAEGFDEHNRVVRKLWVRNFRKIDDTWMIKSMEIQSFPGDTRTKLRIEEIIEPTV